MDGNGARKYQSKDNVPPLVERSRLKRLHYRTRCSVAPRVCHPPSGSYVEEESPHAAVPFAPQGKPDAENQGRASTLLAFGCALGKAVEELQRYLRTKVYLSPKAGTRPGLCAADWLAR